MAVLPPHAQSTDQVWATQQSQEDGLSQAEAARRLAAEGENALPESKRSPFALVVKQLKSIFVWILAFALVLSIALPVLEAEHALGLSDFVDAIVIAGILVMNTALGVFQEARAEKAIAQLASFAAPRANVLREGTATEVPATEVVRGDVLVLSAGDRIPTDARVTTHSGLRVDESALTGESLPVPKQADAVPADAAVADQKSMVFAGTLVTAGSCQAVVTAIGRHTEVGHLAGLLQSAEPPPTPLELQLQRLARLLAIVAAVAVVIIMVVGTLRGMPTGELLLVAVSLGVSMVPEGLPAVVTVCFAVGARHMAQQGALVRRLDALETLGSVSVLCTDKTGTLTENRMTVVEHWAADARVLAQVGASCNRASDGSHGAPTETALLRFAEEQKAKRLAIDSEPVPFSSAVKYMATTHAGRTFYKGAPERLLELTGDDGSVRERVDAMASRGRRVLAAAVAEPNATPQIVGLFGLEDPPREGVSGAVASARSAGVRTVMITGDHQGTAKAIAERVGIEPTVAEGRQLDGCDDAEIERWVASRSVFARVSPEHKVQLCSALQRGGAVVAMTGDGVNDAPALKTAHVGVAMGGRGTDVAREAASIVLADDHYATLVGAIAEGRRSHDNIRRFTLFLLRANFDELLLVIVTFALALPIPYLPVHILWINLLTDGLPALALTAEPAEPDIMERPPRPPDEHLLAGEGPGLVVATLISFAGALAIYLGVLNATEDLPLARTATLTFAVVLELALAFSVRTHAPTWTRPLRSSPWLVAASAAVLVLHVILVYSPLGTLLHLVPLPAWVWAPILGLAAILFLTLELTKPLLRRTQMPR
ncbi:MAG: cation-transporting P-type ATPase [Proteobacteria bacterium]|nr:cation-transporting P-type ATPase [Pseudomonadota bacterium]